VAYQRRDSFHQRAKREGYRSRAAYKLAEVQQRHRLLAPGDRVVDLGCWPGGWLQVAARAVGSRGRVVGVDLRPIEPPLELPNVWCLEGDLAEPDVLDRVRQLLGGPAQVLLSDAAPRLSGVRAADRAHSEELLGALERSIPRLLGSGGGLLVKLLDCPEAVAFQKRLRSLFDSARSLRPEATRKGSSERYLLARGYRGA